MQLSMIRVLPVLLLVACTRQSAGAGDQLAEMTIVCTAYDHAAHIARADTVRGELRQWHQQAERVCTDVEKRGLEVP